MDKVGQIVETSTQRMLLKAPDRIAPSDYLEKLGIHISRYGLVVTGAPQESDGHAALRSDLRSQKS
jgi:hypothetical protein